MSALVMLSTLLHSKTTQQAVQALKESAPAAVSDVTAAIIAAGGKMPPIVGQVTEALKTA